jgi:N-hydroxyarylamine O-acetyltransferase
MSDATLDHAPIDAHVMDRYLERLAVREVPTPSWASLCDLVTRHLHTVPFENLDIINGVLPELSTASVLHKVVTRRRGGFCYEVNEAFRALLTHLGFAARRIEARVWSEARQQFGAPFDHLALVVSLPAGEYLTDVGFGDNNRRPLRLPADTVTDISGEYSLRQTSDDLWLLSRADQALYEMTLHGQPLSAFAAMHHHHQTSPESIFTQGSICTRATPTGRITLSRERLRVVDGAARSDSVVQDRDQALERYFGLLKESGTC